MKEDKEIEERKKTRRWKGRGGVEKKEDQIESKKQEKKNTRELKIQLITNCNHIYHFNFISTLKGQYQ